MMPKGYVRQSAARNGSQIRFAQCEQQDGVAGARTFALVSADVLDRVLGAWQWTRAAQVIPGRGADCVMTVKASMPTLYKQLRRLPRAGPSAPHGQDPAGA